MSYFFHNKSHIFYTCSIDSLYSTIYNNDNVLKLTVYYDSIVNDTTVINEHYDTYMLDFSNIKNKTILDVYLYEKYLVYAVALDIADKVIKEINIPNINLELYNDLINITNAIGKDIEKEYNSYIRQQRAYSNDDYESNHNSSSSGFGGSSSSDGGSYGGGGTSTGRF